MENPFNDGRNLASTFLKVLILVVIAIGAVLPITLDLINSSGATGTTATVLGLVPLFIGLLVIGYMAEAVMDRL